MATGSYKGLTVKIGADTSELGKALEDVNKKSQSLSKELGEVNKLLKMDPGNADLLAQKQKILAEAVENTKEKLDTLKEAEAQVQAQFERGEVSAEQVRALQREIVATEQKLGSYERAVEETQEAVDKLGDSTEESAEALKEQEKKAEAAEAALDDLAATATEAAKTGITALVGAATAAVTAIIGLEEATREYRNEMAKLETAFSQAGYSTEAAKETYKELQSILGETDQAVEAANHIAKLAKNEEDLAKWTEISTGIYASFGASLPIEGLTEAANETMRVGQVTGPLADALNWAAAESETFGVTLKENIDFTKKSAKELSKMTDAQKDEYEARKKQYEEIEKYNESVMEAVSAEDKFNIALANCADEQERQALITETLTKLYSSASKQYKKTNKEVIRANEANEKWNATLAELGEIAAPVATDIKELGASFLEDMAEPMEDVANFVRTKLLPALTNIGSWVRQNVPAISAVLAGLTATIVLHKAAAYSAELATQGLTVASLAQAAAQKALNLVMNANPYVLMATAIIGLATAMGALYLATKENVEPVDVLTAEEKKLAEAADKAAESFREQQVATKEALGTIVGEMDHVTDLKDELLKLAGASGEVDEKNRGRAQFILGQLNEALGTEYQMVDGVIQQYDELKASIDEVMQSKLANSLLEASNADYVAAIQNERDALQNVLLKEQEYLAQKDVLEQKEAEYVAEREKLQERLDLAMETGNGILIGIVNGQIGKLEEEMQAHRDLVAGKKEEYDKAALDYGNYSDTIAEYEEAQIAAMEGNYDRAVDILTDKGEIFGEYAGTVDAETQKVLDTLYKEAVDAGLEAERTKKNFMDGVEGYTEDMVWEADEGYREALAAFDTAYKDATGVGEDLSTGLAEGMESKSWSPINKVKSIVSRIISAARKEADSHSPSRKMIDFGEDMSEGTEIGLENRTKNILDTARRQVDDLMDTYADAGEDLSQTAFTNVSRQTANREAQAYQTAVSGNADKLDKILAAIERGQVLTIDGKQLVGGTAAMYDNELGRRRALAARGAL